MPKAKWFFFRREHREKDEIGVKTCSQSSVSTHTCASIECLLVFLNHYVPDGVGGGVRWEGMDLHTDFLQL